MNRFLTLVIVLLFTIQSLAQNSSIIADGAELKLISDEFSFTEGPAVDPYGNVYFTDQPNNRILKWSTHNGLNLYMGESFRANGLYFDNEGNLLAAADEKNQLIRIAPDKSITILIDSFEDKRLNGPNDIWVDAKGGIYFTDPYYQRPWWDHTEPELDERVYYLSPDSELVIVADDVVKPNGIIGSADGTMLFVADIGDNKTYSYTINEDGTLSDQTLFAELGSDGMTLDDQGNLYLTGNGVTVFNPEGEQIEHIDVPENWTANVTFGGFEQDILFITASKSLYTLQMKVKGVRKFSISK
ncbi:MAG: SMP-30/gluconolactonase/LRE family protein [Balneolaceae bacterium]|nr:SMP-30/gluconolactonase/LRE family protein [Balneolaceae bacterium]MBO6546370.1 SMP-30/gluconolactonase/LRE family protein [Balneolaceae bacterium]MBO6648729.1 SMP-30/gluconolactonase/LRE family protein [Balneolaceae bacterium]